MKFKKTNGTAFLESRNIRVFRNKQHFNAEYQIPHSLIEHREFFVMQYEINTSTYWPPLCSASITKP
jgi:hypothetical protein